MGSKQTFREMSGIEDKTDEVGYEVRKYGAREKSHERGY